jgi:hypothetical protein
MIDHRPDDVHGEQQKRTLLVDGLSLTRRDYRALVKHLSDNRVVMDCAPISGGSGRIVRVPHDAGRSFESWRAGDGMPNVMIEPLDADQVCDAYRA